MKFLAIVLACAFTFTAASASANQPPIDPDNPGDGGGGGGGGGDPGNGNPPPPFDPPQMMAPNEALPIPPIVSGSYQQCNQIPHPFYSFYNGSFSTDIPKGTTLYLSGIAPPGTYVIYGFYDQFGNLAKIEYTNGAKSNCVIHHGENPISTNDLALGYYTLYATYITLSSATSYYGSSAAGYNYYTTAYGYQTQVFNPGMHYFTTLRIR